MTNSTRPRAVHTFTLPHVALTRLTLAALTIRLRDLEYASKWLLRYSFLTPFSRSTPLKFFPTLLCLRVPQIKLFSPLHEGGKVPPNRSGGEQILPAVQSTPLGNTPSIDPTTEADHEVGDFDRYIEADLRERVFIHTEHFFTTILHLSPDWKTDDRIANQIQAIRDDPAFKQHVQTYFALCDKAKPSEKSFYHPDGVMGKRAFDVLGATDVSGLCIYRQDAMPVVGSEEEIIPDTLGVLRAMFTSSGNDVDKMKDSGLERNFSWAQTMHWQEFKPACSFLDEGTDARYRVLSDAGKDPWSDVRGKITIHHDPGSILPPVRSLGPGSTAKRRSQQEPPHTSKYARSMATPDISKARNRSATLTALIVVAEPIPEEADQSEARREAIVQCGRYALEILSSGFRTHCIGALVTMGRIQLLYYDRSIIIVCKPTEMFKSVKPSGSTTNPTEITDEFGALLIALDRLTPKQRGIQEQTLDVFKGVKLSLKLKTVKSDEVVEVTLGRIILHQPAIIGRHTCVVEAESNYKGWEGKELVVKISWPAVERKSEADLVHIAREKARSMKTGKKPDWALDHLPDILLCQDFVYEADSTQANIAAFCKKAKCANNETIDYEHRVCRIMVQERLYPLDELRMVEEYAQVFFDILQIHKRLDGHRTGTLPYMASELLVDKNGQPPKHLYRHDVESIFYAILLLCCRYQVLPTPTSSEPAPLTCEKVSSRFDEWYTLGRATLRAKKVTFIMDDVIVVNSGFASFQPWLNDLHGQFSDGQSARSSHSHRQARGKATGAFDEETLQNQVSYSIAFDICSKFAGSPLAVRNDQLEVAV
ncbi:hypothetical protein F5146DRAFT_1224840 [Armillaria mellea]|nr:hypothetical protein F5146DRAFT_1224840 [Armillaria mellea]